MWIAPAYRALVALAMQELQYRSSGVCELLEAVASARVPCLALINMPPLPCLQRLPSLASRQHRQEPSRVVEGRGIPRQWECPSSVTREAFLV
jgi:hypothetical protein